MALHKQAIGAGDVEVVPVTGTALGTGVHEQHDSRPDQKGGVGETTLLVRTIATTVIALLQPG